MRERRSKLIPRGFLAAIPQSMITGAYDRAEIEIPERCRNQAFYPSEVFLKSRKGWSFAKTPGGLEKTVRNPRSARPDAKYKYRLQSPLESISLFPVQRP